MWSFKRSWVNRSNKHIIASFKEIRFSWSFNKSRPNSTLLLLFLISSLHLRIIISKLEISFSQLISFIRGNVVLFHYFLFILLSWCCFSWKPSTSKREMCLFNLFLKSLQFPWINIDCMRCIHFLLWRLLGNSCCQTEILTIMRPKWKMCFFGLHCLFISLFTRSELSNFGFWDFLLAWLRPINIDWIVHYYII